MAKVQKIHKQYDDHNMAVKYYTIIFALNNINLAKKDVELMAFIANKGYINDRASKEEFSKKYKSAYNTVVQTTTKLKKMGLLSKRGGQLKVAPVFDLNFTAPIFLNIILSNVQ